MKKIFAMLVIISVLVGMFSVAGFADEPDYDFDDFWGEVEDGRDKYEIYLPFGWELHIFKANNGLWYYFHFYNEITGWHEKDWCPICNPDDPDTPPEDTPVVPGGPTDPETPPTSSDPETPPTSSDPETPPTSSEPETPPTSSEPETPPTSSDPVESEPTSSEPTSSEPTSSEPVESEPTSSEPTSSEPVESESAPVETEKEDNDVPDTGDNSMTALWMTVLGVSAMAFIATLIVGKKKSF